MVNRYIQRAVQIDGVHLFALEAPVVLGTWAFLDDAERVDPQILETNPAACRNCVVKTPGEYTKRQILPIVFEICSGKFAERRIFALAVTEGGIRPFRWCFSCIQ